MKGRKDERKEGRKEERKAGRQEGRQAGRKEGTKGTNKGPMTELMTKIFRGPGLRSPISTHFGTLKSYS